LVDSPRTLAYAVLTRPAKGGGYVVTGRDLPELITQGDRLEHALAEAVDAMDEAIAARMDDGEDLPAATASRKGEYIVTPSAELGAKAALYLAMREAGISKAELARRLRVDEKEVRRLLDTRHPSSLPRMDEAIPYLGKRLVLSLRPAIEPPIAAAHGRDSHAPTATLHIRRTSKGAPLIRG
jgi:antitoxin HicB